jgi:hypothetical protein
METIKKLKNTRKLFTICEYLSFDYKISVYTNYCLIFFILFLLIVTSSCTPRKVKEVLGIAENNRSELEKVIDHYRKVGDEQKLKAAYFLIGNMANKYSTVWLNRKEYDKLYRFIDSTRANNKTAEVRWDSLKKVYGVKTDKKLDAVNIKASLLIDNIDVAFYTWRNTPWGKYYNFDQFCEYILPYRISDEPLENWRPFFFKEMQWVLDSLHNKKDVRIACKFINDWVNHHHRLLGTLGEVPKLGAIDAYYHPAGICEHRILLTVSILRTFGIPCAIDYTPQYTNFPGGHPWIVLIDTTGKPMAFSGGDILKYPKTNKMPMGFGKWTATKIYRNTFAYEFDFFKSKAFGTLFNNPCYDVTNLYDMKMGSVCFGLPKTETNDIFLCTFGKQSKIVPVACTKAHNDKVVFENVGLNAFYLPAVYRADELVPLLTASYFDSLGVKIDYVPNIEKKRDLILTRKYPDISAMKYYGGFLLGAKIEASTDKSFKHPVLLHQIDSIPYYFVSYPVSDNRKFKYARYLAADTGYNCLAELEFFSDTTKLSGKIENSEASINPKTVEWAKAIFDGDIKTFMSVGKKAWVMLTFDKPYSITKIKYVQRNDMNFVERGHKYELLYFNKEWISFGVQKANDSYLHFSNVPTNTILLLRDLSEGNQERMFKYENGKQIFW